MPGVENLLRATGLAEDRHFWFRGFRAFVTPLIQRALDNLPHPRILDCGCGTGANLDLLGRFGRAFGFDLSIVGLALGKAAGRTQLVQATVAAAPFQSDVFDLVTSFDVLYALEPAAEHAAVAELFRLTRPGGYALINVAAMNVLRGDHSVLSREVRRYERSGLERLVVAAGFTVVRLTYTNFTLFLPLVGLRIFQRWRGLAPESEAGREISLPPALVNEILSGLLRLESFWIRWFDCPFGSSLVCLARKPADASDAART
jgi:SAM-dependent methyltransferase